MSDALPRLTREQAAKIMGVSVRSVSMAGELQRCNRPDLEERCMSGELTIRQALRLALPGKYGKRDKVEQWLAQFRAWSPSDRLRGLAGLGPMLEAGEEIDPDSGLFPAVADAGSTEVSSAATPDTAGTLTVGE